MRATGEQARRVRAPLVMSGLVSLLLWALWVPSAAAAPWACDETAFQTRWAAGADTVVSRIVRGAAGAYVSTDIGQFPDDQINALGFRTQDGFMYAFDRDTQQIVRIERDGQGNAVFLPSGSVPGLPSRYYYLGTFLSDGTYLIGNITEGDGAALIDVSGPAPVLLQLLDTTTLPELGDIAVNPADDRIYASLADGSATYEIRIDGPDLVLGPRAGEGVAGGGAQWFSPQAGAGVLFANATTSLSAIDFATGSVTEFGPIPSTTDIDGAACAYTVSLTKSAAPSALAGGERTTFTYSLTNRGSDAGSISFDDSLPLGMSYVPNSVTVSPPTGTITAGPARLLIDGIRLTHNQAMTVTAQVELGAGACGTLDNTAQATYTVAGLPPATVSSDDPATPGAFGDPTRLEVICLTPSPPAPPAPTPPKASPPTSGFDVSLHKSVSVRRARPGSTVSYTLLARNHGPSSAPGVRVRDIVPDDLNVRRATASGGICDVKGNAIACSLGTIDAGAVVAITITADAVRSGRTTNTAIADPRPQDRNPENNQDSAALTIDRPALRLRKTASTSRVDAGARMTFTLRASSRSNTALHRVRVCDHLPAGLQHLRSTPASTLRDGRLCWSTRRLAPRSSRAFSVVVRALSGTSGRRVNRAIATSPGATPARAQRAVHVRQRQPQPGGVTG